MTRWLELDPNFGLPHRWLMWAYLLTDRFDEAEAAGRRAAALSGEDPSTSATLVRAVQNPGSKSEALKILATSTDQSWRSWALGLGDRALWYVLIGENELALETLARLADEGLGNAFGFRDPILRPLHEDPRFQELLERVGLAQ